MNFDQLKELVRKVGGILVMDGDRPEFVILSYNNNKYKDMEAEENVPISSRAGQNGLVEEEKSIEKLNQEISALKEGIRQKESAELLENMGDGGEGNQTPGAIDLG